jgi:hypothetical protein
LESDIHCVTSWSELDMDWQGVSFNELIRRAGSKSRRIICGPPATMIPAANNGMSPVCKHTKSGTWRDGTVTQIRSEAIGIRSYTFAFDSPVQHLAGQ